MVVVVGGGVGPHETCALGRGGTCTPEVGRDGARAPGSDEAKPAPSGSDEVGPASPGSGEPESTPSGSDEVAVTPFNRLGELVADNHQSPFFGYPYIGTRQIHLFKYGEKVPSIYY
jgi:hypothetical protein